ncbi:MAG: DNA alkylation repair protein [Bacteroidales bacterium]|nr:DNA alkylation repair protein [Bacteroidales bacterium]
MESLKDDEQRNNLMRFFKTEKPEDYGFGDEFLGIKMPDVHVIVKNSKDLPLQEIPNLLTNKWHEVRMCGFLLLVHHFSIYNKKRLINDLESVRRRDEIVEMYLNYAEYANNWDLVDLSAPKIIGEWLLLPTLLGTKDTTPQQNESYKYTILDSFADSKCLWKQRISMVCTMIPTKHDDASWCLYFAEKHLKHPHDLMHKAVGWMLRDVYKTKNKDLVLEFLESNIKDFPRTTLRYTIEKMPKEEREYWLKR